jgi:hypothetical protein
MTGSGMCRFSAVTAKLSYIGGWRMSFHENSASSEEAEDLDLRLFLDSRDRNATDARDKIFALRGIANKALGTRITVNYDSVEKV